MEQHLQFSDCTFERLFETATLNSSYFSHQAHIRLAWLHIHHYGLDQAIANITRQIKNFTKVVGAPDKYHETVTIAAIKAVYHFMQKSSTESFVAFIEENPRLQHQFPTLIAAHYDFDIFSSKEARIRFMEPTLLPFD